MRVHLPLISTILILGGALACSSSDFSGESEKGSAKEQGGKTVATKENGEDGSETASGAPGAKALKVAIGDNVASSGIGKTIVTDLTKDPKLGGLTWKSSDPKIATVSPDGAKITTVGAGDVEIVGVDADGNVVAKIKLSVSPSASADDDGAIVSEDGTVSADECKPTTAPSPTTLVHRIQKSGLPNSAPAFAYTTEAQAVVNYAGAAWNNNGPAFRAFGQGVPKTAQAFLCEHTEASFGTYQFLSLDSLCEGTSARAIPWVTVKTEQDLATLVPVYRCNNRSRMSTTATSECDGLGATGTQFGWVLPANGPDAIDVEVPCVPALPAITLVYRIQKAGLPANAPAFAYTTESKAKVDYAGAVWDNNGPAFKAFGQNVPNTVQTFLCALTDPTFGTYQFLSLDKLCEATAAAAVPWVTVKSEQDDPKLVPIYRCNNGSRMSTTATSECEGLGATSDQFGWVYPP